MLLFKCIDRPRTANEPPFFFQEVRLGMLMLSILYNIARLVYELTVMDISVLLVAARLLLTSLQLLDQWWFCKNWASFFLEKQMRAYIWFRLFIAVSMWSILFTVQTTFSPSYTNLTNDAFLWAAGIQTMIWYFWGKRWNFRWGDMCDERRIPAFVGTMFTSSLLSAGLCVYIRQSQLSSIITALTATMAYFLMGLAFRYLNVVTALKASEKTAKSAADDIHPPSLPPPVQMPRNNVTIVPDENNHIEMFRDPENNNDTDKPPASIGDYTQPTSPYISQSISPDGSTLQTAMVDGISSLVERGSSNYNTDGGGSSEGRVKPIFAPTFSPMISPMISRNGSFSHMDDGSHVSNKCEILVDSVRFKPNNSLSHLHSPLTGTLGPSLRDNNNDHVTVDHMPLVRQNTYEMNLAYYETSHLLSDKIVVVFVQVMSLIHYPLPLPNLNHTTFSLFCLGFIVVHIYDGR